MRSPVGGYLAVEVKTLRSFEFLLTRISPGQKRRLLRTWSWILEKYPNTPYLVAYVEPRGSILFMSLGDH